MKKVREKEEIMKENVIKFIKNNWRWMLLFICLIGFLALAEEVFHQEIMNGDIVGYDIVSKLFKFNVFITENIWIWSSSFFVFI